MADLLAAALAYADAGCYVFPARVGVVDGRKYVHPVKAWRESSSVNPAQLREWFAPGQPWSTASLCIDCGRSRLVVVDLDVTGGHDGITAWGALMAGHDIAPTPVRAHTPSGGEHWYYAEHPHRPVGIDSSGKVAEGVDIRGLGGFVIAWPSEDARGAYGQIDPAALAHLPVVPDLVVQRMLTRREATENDRSAPTAAPLTGTSVWDEMPREFTYEAAVAWCRPAIEALRAAPVGQINHRLNDAAVTLGHFVGDFWTAAQATRALMAALEHTEYDGRTWRAEATIASGLGAKTWRAKRAERPAAAVDGPVEVSELDAMRAELLDTDGLDSIDDLTPLVRGVLSLDTVARINGKSTHGKSFVVLDLAGHIGTGRPWHGHEVRQGEVVYLVAEGARGVRRRVRAWERYYGVRMTGVRFLPRPVDVSSPQWKVLGALMAEIRPALVVIDTQARVTVGMDENDNSEMGILVDRMERMRRASGACVLLVHHLGHSGEEGRGATAVKAALQTELLVTRKGRVVTLTNPKQKDDGDELTVRLAMTTVDLDEDQDGYPLTSLVLVPETPATVVPADWIENATENQARILGVVADHFPLVGGTKAEVRATLHERFGQMPRTSFNRAWDSVVGKDYLIKVKGTAKYVLGSMHENGTDDD